MIHWLIDLVTTAVGVLCVIAFLFGVVAKDPELDKPRSSRFNPGRREITDRRRDNRGPPEAVERRVGARRQSVARRAF